MSDELKEKLSEFLEELENDIYQSYREGWGDAMDPEQFTSREVVEHTFERDWNGSISKNQMQSIRDKIKELENMV